MNISLRLGQKWGVKNTAKVVLFLLPIFVAAALALPASAAGINSISGLVFEDLNISQLADLNEPGLADWRLNLLQNGVLIASLPTGSDGRYLFDNLADGQYTVSVEKPGRWAAVGSQIRTVTVNSGEAAAVDFGFYQVIRDDYVYGPMTQLSTISIEPISLTEVRVSWFTNLPAGGQLVYDTAGKSGIALASDNISFGYARASSMDFSAKTFHTLVLSNLEPDKNYHFRIVALLDPLQWRGSAYLLSDELTFSTGDGSDFGAAAGSADSDTAGKAAAAAAGVKPAVIPRIGKILSEELQPEELAEIEQAEADAKAGEAEAVTAQPGLFLTCIPYIWLLLLANIIAAGFIHLKFKGSAKPANQKIWWLMLIISLIPSIIEYPDCSLVFWLLITLIISLIIITFLNTKAAPSGGNTNEKFFIDPESIDYGDRLGRTENGPENKHVKK